MEYSFIQDVSQLIVYLLWQDVKNRLRLTTRNC